MSSQLNLSDLTVESFEPSSNADPTIASISFADCSEGAQCTKACVWPTYPEPGCN